MWCIPVCVSEPGIAFQIGPQHGQGVQPPKHLVIDFKGRHAKDVQGNGVIGMRLELGLDPRQWQIAAAPIQS